MQTANGRGPAVWLVGDVDHPDFAESIALVRSTRNVGSGPPAMIVVAQCRPGAVGELEVERLRRSAPLAGVVSLCGSWCEGELRTGRPLAGATRLYWYEFPSWWRRQLALHEAGLCPEWARSGDCGSRVADCGLGAAGRFVVSTAQWDTFAAIADLLRSVRCESVWVRPWSVEAILGPVSCGIWEGGQLSDVELERLAEFTGQLSNAGAPVVALFDFPRGDRCELARRVGAAEVLGKPWLNSDLVASLHRVLNADCIAARVA